MTVQGYGYAVIDYGSAWELDRQLSQLVERGFTHAEVRPEGWQVWSNGQLDNRALARLTAVLDKHRPHLDYVMPLPTAMNLFDLLQPNEHLKLFQKGIQVGKQLGAKLLLYQPGYRSERPASDFVAMSHLMEKERSVLLPLLDEVAAWGGQIAMQTPYYAPGACATYAVWPELLAQQIKQIAHRSLSLCLDFNQVYLAANWLGFDYVQAIQQLLPLAHHFHIQDVTEMLYNTTPVDDSLLQSVTYLPMSWNQPRSPTMGNPMLPLPATLSLFLQEKLWAEQLLPANQPLFGLPQTAVTA